METRMVRSLTLVTAPCLGAGATAISQSGSAPHPEEAAILAVVDRFMHAVSTKDSALLTELRLEGGVNIVERPAPSGGTLVTRRVFTPASGGGAGTYRERYWDPVVHVRGSIAVVWTPYEFWIDGKTSHCGIDVFDMMKDQGAWKIANMMWTVEPEACTALRPADLSRIRPPR
jgi:hypothetical protein